MFSRFVSRLRNSRGTRVPPRSPFLGAARSPARTMLRLERLEERAVPATATNVMTNHTSEFAPDAFTVRVPAFPTDPLLPPNPGPGLLALIDLFSHHPQLLRGLNLALGDVTGDNALDVVVAGGRGKQPFVLVVDGQTGRIDQAFFAFTPGYRGGVQPNTADVNADGVGDIIATAPGKKGTHIRVFDGKTGRLIFSG
jgi:hypothetical protein